MLQQIESVTLLSLNGNRGKKQSLLTHLENYVIESRELTDKIILIAEPETAGRKQFLYYWAAAASFILLIGSLFLLSDDFTSNSKPEIAETTKKYQTPVKDDTTDQSQSAPVVISVQKQFGSQKEENQTISVAEDSNTFIPTEITLAEIPLVIDSVPVISNELAKAYRRKNRVTSSPLKPRIFRLTL